MEAPLSFERSRAGSIAAFKQVLALATQRKTMKTIRDTSTVPDEGWQYPGLNGHTIHTRNYSLYYGLVVEHYQTNGVAPPSEQEVIDYACTNLRIPCYESETRQPLINRLTQGLPSINGPSARSCCGKK